MNFICNNCSNKTMKSTKGSVKVPFCSKYKEDLKTTIIGMLSNPVELTPCKKCVEDDLKSFEEVEEV